MNQALTGFLRGLGYVLVFAALDYVSKNLGAILSPSLATLGTALVASLEHYLNDPSAPSDTTTTPQ